MEFKKLFRILSKRIWLIALIVIVGCAISAVYSFFYVTPVYQASAKILVNKTDNGFVQAQPLNASEITANIMLVNTYKEIIKSRAIMDEVVAQYPQLNLTTDQLIRKVSVSSLNETQVMTISVTDFSHERAVLAVNAVSQVFQEQIPFLMRVDNVKILNEANVRDNPVPINSGPFVNMLISFIASLFLAVCLSLLLDYWDDTIKSEHDVTIVLGVPTYGVIQKIKPKDLNPSSKNKKMMEKKERVEENRYASVNQ
ncbi:lipopolysaccharide biosynthesis protein [Xylanibacillus composti]|nr:lipopolysaccharide biosynthesis protein [Xylanibacillus composti]